MIQSQENCLYVNHRYHLRAIGRRFVQYVYCAYFVPIQLQLHWDIYFKQLSQRRTHAGKNNGDWPG